MDEQVIDDLYNRAKGLGYSKSRDEFISLLHTDNDVLNDNYSYVKSKGYKKSIEDFSVLTGNDVKKKKKLLLRYKLHLLRLFNRNQLHNRKIQHLHKSNQMVLQTLEVQLHSVH